MAGDDKDRVAIPPDPEESLRAALKVKPDADPGEPQQAQSTPQKAHKKPRDGARRDHGDLSVYGENWSERS
jgi:hypothetical protein